MTGNAKIEAGEYLCLKCHAEAHANDDDDESEEPEQVKP